MGILKDNKVSHNDLYVNTEKIFSEYIFYFK